MHGPDQDNALVHLGSDGDDPWFAELGRRVADLLDRAGVPYCRGGVMAREQSWRHTLRGWESIIRCWAAAASPEDALATDIFFDFTGAAGSIALAERLRGVAMAAVATSPMLIQRLSVDLARTKAPLSLFGRFQTNSGRVDLKLSGLLPIVGAARALALRHGILVTSTPERLRQLTSLGRLPDADFSSLSDAYSLVVGLVLGQQVIDAVAGRPPDGKVEVGRLSRVIQSQLKNALRDVEAFARGVAAGFT